MSNTELNKWSHPYTPAKKYSKRVAYLSMEFAIDQALKIYSGGLGFLAGSHMRSAYQLKQNMIGIGLLWKYGYYDQSRTKDQFLEPKFVEKNYTFLKYTGIQLDINILDNPGVKVNVYLLDPSVFHTVPMYFLSTDVDGNDHLSRTITDHLYDANSLTRIAQSMVLGIGGAMLIEKLGGVDVVHLNEGHALPAFYYLKDRGYTKENFVFTTHTPEMAGNEERDGAFLNEMRFFTKKLSTEELAKETLENGMLSYTLSALRLSKKANAVSKIHAKVAKGMWSGFKDACEIMPITNAQDEVYWCDKEMSKAAAAKDLQAIRTRKRQMKEELFKEVADQTGKLFDPDVLTVVWARRFAGYKRADLLLSDEVRFDKILNKMDKPIQVIWAGKPYPKDTQAIATFNRLQEFSKYRPNVAVLVGYELELSRKLKNGSDVWLNNPRVTREASGTSGMTAAMNGSVNLSTYDGWIPEFARDGENSFVIPPTDIESPLHEQDKYDQESLYYILENRILPLYYDDNESWVQLALQAMQDVLPGFGSLRMADQYYSQLY